MKSGAESDKNTAYLTHEMRTPLTVIIAALKLLQENQMSTHDRTLTGMAISSAHKLNDIVDDILATAKDKVGAMKIDLKPCDPVRLAKETAEALEPWTRRDGVKLSVFSLGECPMVIADPERLSQVMTNLISNALKFTPTRGLVDVFIERGFNECRGYVVVTISDNGSGIPPEEQKQIFEEFSQGTHGRPKSAGTGLGLTLARSLIEKMGGWLWVESEPGSGAAFRFTLPAHASRA